MINELLFLLSFIMLFYGGELLVKSSVSLALRMNVSTLVVGMTVVSFATSSPELFVSIQSTVIQDITDVTFGSVIGSNIANITLVLALTAIVFKINVDRTMLIINYPFMLFSSLLLGIVVYFNSWTIDRLSGIIFVVSLLLFSWVIINRSRRDRLSVNHDQVNNNEFIKDSLQISIVYMIIGIILLYFGSQFLVDGVEAIALYFNISESIISVSLVAIGTSIPELATSLVAAFRKQTNLALGNLIGSNIFNVLAVLGVTSIFKPIYLSDQLLITHYIWMLLATVLLGLLLYFYSKRVVSKIEGFILLSFYILFMVFCFLET